MEWKLDEAEVHLNELLTKAVTEGPQTIRRHGEVVIVMAEGTYRALTRQRPHLKEWLLNGPRVDDLELPSREPSLMRALNL